MKVTIDFFNKLNLEKVFEKIFAYSKYLIIILLCVATISFGGKYLLSRDEINKKVREYYGLNLKKKNEEIKPINK